MIEGLVSRSGTFELGLGGLTGANDAAAYGIGIPQAQDTTPLPDFLRQRFGDYRFEGNAARARLAAELGQGEGTTDFLREHIQAQENPSVEDVRDAVSRRTGVPLHLLELIEADTYDDLLSAAQRIADEYRVPGV